jgi:uncharacterized membrane protein YjgN (DUF898 family)
MNDMSMDGVRAAPGESAFEFRGTWREFLPIAATNLLLTLVTLGFYRFWATTRERRYLWSRTHFIDDRLEWAGTGKEMFLGFLIVMAAFIPILLFLNFGLQALVLRGEFALATGGAIAAYTALLYLFNVARFRALRYRLSRTYWHGIRGGSDDRGWSYGASALWKSVLGALPLGLCIPWATVRLWRERWGAMSFGPHAIEPGEGPAARGLMGRYLLLWFTPVLLVIVAVVAGAGAIFASMAAPQPAGGAPNPAMGTVFALSLAFYLIWGLAALFYYAAFFRKVVGEMSLSGLTFSFTARTRHWFGLVLGNLALVVFTLGLGLVFVGYRNWSFFVRHMDATGDIDTAALTQSTTRTTSDAEGLADAFDIGAI